MLKENLKISDYKVCDEDELIVYDSDEGKAILSAWDKYKKMEKIKDVNIDPTVPISFAMMYENKHYNSFSAVLDLIVWFEMLEYQDSWYEFIKILKLWIEKY